ncbi:homocysteine-responsive endoplasmic reticulum-resident ubiquitin domain member 2 protein-like [Tropilaelaps mercedesae]|uniref:Homocysteine-responsive endoplasmic reticulum-resident ubiquitin domain member 2 protein-like n=1 Tax=Tropilaelaps mercedesae TaxID=418985 RepID=A0A1V9XWP8_9ACAR|nr:homocysteine-responsive endoplasmic reticulum-resident ubiquitin domain member 2 protein-like [Tropilaelaps mercedesae]
MPDPASPETASSTPETFKTEDQLVVVVRAPNQETQDFRVECPETWSVLRLKEHLQQSYQGNPMPTDQKLIYSGQLLDDNSILREVIRQDGSCSQHTVHLVCRPPQGSQMNDGPSGNRSRPPNAGQRLQDEVVQQRVLGASGVAAEAMNELRYRGPMIQYEMASLRPDIYSAHVLALQSMYAQYYQQLLAHQQALILGSNPASSIQYNFNPSAFQSAEQQQQQLFAQMAAIASGSSQGQLNNNNFPGLQQQQVQQQVNNNNNNFNNNNVINQRANDEDGNGAWGNANRDWLDFMYVAIRAVIFATFVYFYSSLERFVLVTGLGMLLYLYQQGLLGLPNIQPQAAPQQPVQGVPVVQPQAQQQAQPQQPLAVPPANVPPPLVADRDGAHVNNNNPAAAQQQREDIERLQAAMDGNNPRAMAGDAPPMAPGSNVARPQSPLAAAASLLRAFLVSLIPDHNNPQ